MSITKDTHSRSPAPSKVVLLGLDGATLDVLEPFMSQGLLPNFKRIADEGVSSRLCSTYSTITASAWISFMTGVNPGKHGVYDFFKPFPQKGVSIINNYRSIKIPTIWELLGEAGVRVGAVNVPMTYPVPEVNGFMLGGMFSQGTKEGFSYPRGLFEKYSRRFEPYQIDVPLERFQERGGEHKFLDALLECTRTRWKYIHALLREEPWDFFMPVFVGMDRIQHKLWEYVDPNQNREGLDGKLYDKVMTYYRLVDQYLGEIMDYLGDQGDLIIISDHGFGPLEREFLINSWLRQKGYLKIKRSALYLRNSLKTVLNSARRFLQRIKPENGFPAMSPGEKAGLDSGRRRLDPIDWSRTVAYTPTRTVQGVYVNLKGREPQGIVHEGKEKEELIQEMISGLKGVRDPRGGGPLFAEVKRKEEVYRGPHLELAPDLVYRMKGGKFISNAEHANGLFMEPTWKYGTGTHRPDGVLMAYGPHIRGKSAAENAKIEDICPTLLYLFDRPVPEYMDGRVIEEILEEELLRTRLRSYCKEEKRKNLGDEVFSEDEIRGIEDRLRGLGYIE
ncbi:MAG: alkaline phosphatase family protein [Planctomycetes bacterium]|nr:alkaline phosphatase family protein [Planctomycetota bacterium]